MYGDKFVVNLFSFQVFNGATLSKPLISDLVMINSHRGSILKPH